MVEFNKLGGNGTTETKEQLEEAIQRNRAEFMERGGVFTQNLEEKLSLLKQFSIPPGDSKDPFIQLAFMLDFENEEERSNVVSAYYEAKRLGMDIEWNVGDAITRSATNKKGRHINSRVAVILQTLNSFRYTSNQPKGSDGYKNPRSPIQS